MKKFDKVIEKVEKAIVEDVLERYNHPNYWDYDLIQQVTHDTIQEVYGYDDEVKTMKGHKFIGIHEFEDGEIGIETITIDEEDINDDVRNEYGEDAPRVVAREMLERNDSGLTLLSEEEAKRLVRALQKALKEDIKRIERV